MKFKPIGIYKDADTKMPRMRAADYSTDVYDAVELRTDRKENPVIIMHSKRTAPLTWKVVYEPYGLLLDTNGAEIVTTTALTYDSVIDLFFSVEPEYRAHATWLMNDRTALALRKLKDEAGNYLWNGSADTILGKPVRICNDMPDIAAGAKPVLFGDFSYYWIVDRSPVSMKALKERFAMSARVGYVAFELLDARLVRREAVKAISVTGESE